MRSTTLDDWTDKQVQVRLLPLAFLSAACVTRARPPCFQTMTEWGNKRAAEYWAADVPPSYKVPTEYDSVPTVERWIRDKYERKLFVRREGHPPPHEHSTSKHASHAAPHAKPAGTPHRAMAGFSIESPDVAHSGK